MAGLFDDLIPGAKPGAAGGGMFADLIPAKPKTRNPAAVANDWVIEAANAVAGGVGSVADFVAPGNAVSEFINENIIKPGEASQSDAVRAAKAKYAADMEAAGGIGDEIGATLGYAAGSPGIALSRAVGSFVLPGAAVKGGGMLASMAGAGAKGATRAGLAGGAVAGAALSGGDAAGAAYELVKKAGGTDDEAAEAARRASVLPAAIGAAGGVIGAERLLAGAGGFKGGALSRALKTAGVEGAQEAVEEGVTQYEGQRAAVPFDPSIDPLKGVAGAATMGAVLGGTTGAGVSLLHGKPAEPKKDAGDILAAPTVDDAISNAMLAIAGPVSKPAWEVVDGLALPGPAQPAQPTMLRSLPAPDGQTVYMADERGNVAPQPAEARTEALNRQFEAGQQADAAARATDELNSTLGITPGLRAAQQQRALRDAEDSLIPVGEAAELPDIPTGEATELEPIPAGEASELVPTPDATELEPIPAGEATELEVQTIEPGDLMAKDGEPFVSKTGAQARAFSTGGRVVPIPDHFGSGKPGFVVRPITEGRPNNTRGTNAADAIRAGGASTADAGRGDGVAGVPDSRPADVLAGAASPAGQGVAGAGAAGNGAVQRDALTPGQRVTLPNKDGVREAWTVDGQTGNVLRLDNGKGRMRAVQVGSPTWDAIQPEGGAATDQAINQNGVSETAGGQPLAGTLQPTPQADAKPSTEPPRTQAPAPAAAAATEPAAAAAGPAPLEAGGLKGRKTLQEARTDTALDKEVSENGKRMTRRQWVEGKVAEGLPTRITQEDRIKPMSRMQFFRANNEEQRAHERKIKEAGKKDVFWIGDYEVTKIEHDYATRLAESVAEPAGATSRIAEPNDPNQQSQTATPNTPPLAPTGNADKPGPAKPEAAPGGINAGEPVQAASTGGAAAPESEQVAPKPKVYKTLMAAKLASKQGGNTTRVKKISGGYILREATEKELAAAEKAGRRLAAPKVVDQGQDTLLTAIAKLGGLAMTEKADTIGEGNKLTKGGHLFRQGGQGIDTMAESLKELHYIPSHEHERDGGVRWLRDAIKAEYMGVREHFSEAGDKWMGDLQAEAESRYNQDALSDFDLDELDASGYTQISPEAQALTEQLLAEAEALGLDTETLRDDAVRASEGKTDDEYHAELQAIAREAIGKAQRDAEERNAAAAGRSTQDDGKAAGDQGQEGSGQGLTLTAQTAEDLKSKTEREAAGEAAAKAKRDAEQARLRKEAEARDLKARADATVDDFQLGQDADQQMSGMDDLFAQPAPAPAEQAAAILNAAAEPPKGAERLSVLKDVKAGAITPEEVAAAYPPAENDRDHFTLERGIGNNTLEKVTFARGEYITYQIGEGGKWAFGEIEGISHAKREFNVDGVWHPFGFAYKAERPAPVPKHGTEPLSKTIDRINKKFGEGLTDADKVPEPTTPAQADADLWKKVTAGEATTDEFKAGFEDWVANKPAILAEFNGKTKADLLKMGGAWFTSRYKGDTKPEIAEALWRQGASAYTLDRAFQYGMGKDAFINGIRRMVEETDADQLAQYVADRKAAQEEALARVAKVAEAIKDPKTLSDYQTWMRATMEGGKSFKEARMMLTPEQRAAYDYLAAESSRSSRKARADDDRTTVRAAGQSTAGIIIATKHTRDGHDLWVVKLADRVGKDDYTTLLNGAKRLGGNYSSFRGNGAVPGFQFRTPEAAQAFLKLAGGDTARATEVAQERRNAFEDDRSQSAAERLTEMADRLEERADESLGRDRKDNTERRARFAAAAEAAASADKAMAKTMRNIAQAIGRGGARFLDRVRQKVQVELLQNFVKTAQYEEQRTKYPSYADQQKHQGEPPTTETADHAEFPQFTAYRSDLASLGRQLLEVDGTKKMGERLMKVADDVSDAFTAFVKEPGNLMRLSTFSIRAGDDVKAAIFPTREAAERAIQRSGLSGKAIVFPEKRGVNRIIMSPSEAMARGIWKGDGDKRITLSDEFGNELVEKIGRAARRGSKVSVPWQFERVYDRRKQLARMGIETPAEFRAALREFIAMREQPAEADKIKAMERAMIGRRNDGLDFFPTPESVADEMVAAADIQPGMRVLEPSAGMGHIAERIRASEVEPDVGEFSADRRELLEAKGFNVVARDFMGLTEGGYDRILMNPPFSDGRDIQHVRHAYDLLKPGGRLVAIIGESAFFNQNKRATEFREWLESVGGTDEKLPEGTFNDPSLPVNTGANARMVVIEKPTGASNESGSVRDDDVGYAGRGMGGSGEAALRERAPGSEGEGGEGARFSRAPAGRTATMTVPQVQGIVANIKAAWRNAPNVVVVESLSGPEVPERVREAERAAATNGAGVGRGVILGDTIYLAASAMGNDAMVAETLFHEALGHYGLRGMFGKDLDTILGQLAKALPEKVTAKAIEYGLNPLEQADRLTAAEEVLAEIAQTRPTSTWVQRAIAAIRTWLRTNIPGFADMALNEAEVIRNFIAPARAFVERGRLAAMRDMPAFSRGPAGQTNTPEFKRWFGDSKVVDAEGKPLVLYHGTGNDFSTFMPSDGGEYGAGIYLTPDAKGASDYARYRGRIAPNVMPVYVSIKNPAGPAEAANIGSWRGEEAIRSELIRRGYDGIIDKFSGQIVAFNPEQIKSAIGNSGAFDPANADIRFSRAPSAIPAWISSGSAALQGAAGKIDTYAPTKTIAEKAREMSAGWKQKLVQGMFDAYAPLKALSMDAYIAARMTKAADGAFEGMLMYGRPVMTADGGITGDLDGKGFLGAMRELNGEHDRFFMWLAGNRAERLMAEGKENLFTPAEIAAMKALNGGATPDGKMRAATFKKALDEFNLYSKSVLDVAEKAGLIDGESRKLWEHDFYVPFYRMSQENEISGPTKIKGLVRQKAFERLKGGKENLGDLMDNTLRNWSHLLSASLANVAASKSLLAAERAGIAIEAKEAQAKEMAKAAGLKGNATYFMDQGLQRWFVVEDPAVLQAISSMEAPALNGLPLQIMAKFKKYLTIGVTIAPAFKVRNLIRDTLAAPAANEMSFNIAKNLAQGWKATDTKTSGYAQMLFSGGLMRFGTYLEGDRAENVKRLIADGVDDKTILNTPQKVKAMLGKAWDAWQDFGDRMENVNRTALYQQLLDKGMTPREAAFQARDMMDFSLQGSWAAMRTLTAVVPFLNARAQGLYKLGRAAAENPKRMGYMVAAVSLASIALMLAYQDDDDWKAREDWDRDAWWWFKIGETAYRIPKPFEVGAMGTIAERSLELVISDEMTGARFAERMKQMVTGTFAINPVPQMFKPMLDLYANKDSFTGRQIETLGMERLSKPERYGPNTSALAKALGSAGDYTGVSPVQVDHMIRAYFGWLGTMGAATVDAATSPFSEIEKPAKKMDDYFGGFVKELPAASSRYLEDFYEQAKATSEAMADLRRAREAGDTEKAAEIMEERGDKVAQYRVYQQAQQQLAGLNKRIRIVRSSTELDADTKRLRLDELTELRNRIARQVSDRTRAREEALQ